MEGENQTNGPKQLKYPIPPEKESASNLRLSVGLGSYGVHMLQAEPKNKKQDLSSEVQGDEDGVARVERGRRLRQVEQLPGHEGPPQPQGHVGVAQAEQPQVLVLRGPCVARADCQTGGHCGGGMAVQTNPVPHQCDTTR